MVVRRGGRELNTNTAVTYKYTKAKRRNPEQNMAKMNWGTDKKK